MGSLKNRILGIMSPRFRPFGFIVLTGLIITLLMGPPLAIASNLPTACNIFDKRDKAGPCGHRAMFSKIQDKSFEAEGVLFSNDVPYILGPGNLDSRVVISY